MRLVNFYKIILLRYLKKDRVTWFDNMEDLLALIFVNLNKLYFVYFRFS